MISNGPKQRAPALDDRGSAPRRERALMRLGGREAFESSTSFSRHVCGGRRAFARGVRQGIHGFRIDADDELSN